MTRSAANSSLVMALLVWTAAGGSLSAQDEGRVEPRGCFSGRPLPECRTFWITEVALGIQVGPLNEYESANDRWLPFGELGMMRNVGPRFAAGATLGAGFLHSWFVTVKPRLRYWVSPAVALDVAPGIFLNPPYTTGTSNFESDPLLMDVSLMLRERLGLSATAFRVNGDPRFYLGARAGSSWGIKGAGLGAAGFLAVILLFVLTCDGGCS